MMMIVMKSRQFIATAVRCLTAKGILWFFQESWIYGVLVLCHSHI